MLKITNTLSRETETFKPIEPGKVRFYHCGPTVYWTQHIGNMRAMTMADIVRRSLIYLGYDVKMVRNYTDVGHLDGDNVGDADQGEDRMEKAAKREKATPQEIATKYIEQFENDIARLNILLPDEMPRATQYVNEVIEMVQVLVDKGFAYMTEKAVYFDVSKAKNYTALSRQNKDEVRHGSGTGDVSDPDKQNPADFALWFFKTGAHENALQTWESPFSSPVVEKGTGFPGWHIECSAMSKNLLGETIDIHMGGIEHVPIHHTNEIAQSESANGVKFVNYWLHNEHLTVDGGKMAKSEGTGFSLDEVVERGFRPLALRYFFLGAHYRSKQNFTWEALEGAQTGLLKLKNRVHRLSTDLSDQEQEKALADPKYVDKFKKYLEDDFDAPGALALTWEVAKEEKLDRAVRFKTLLNFDSVLGLDLDKFDATPIPKEVKKLVEMRDAFREKGDWGEADKLRAKIQNLGFDVEDTDEGPSVSHN